VLTAQADVHGTVRDSTSGTPLPLVEVAVEGMNLSTLTDAKGRYSISIPLGIHTIVFRRVGYHAVTRQLRLSTNDLMRVDIVMLSQAQRLDSIRVIAPVPPSSWPPGIADRMKDGFGQFVTDSMLRRFEHSSMSNLLQSQVHRVRFKRVGGRNVAFSGRGPGMRFGRAYDCYYSIWLDGILIWKPGDYAPGPGGTMQGSPPPDLDRISIVGIEAVEVYTPAQVPQQYGGTNSPCGTILFWSRTQRN